MSDNKVCEELKGLALHFFMNHDMVARDAYAHALSFLSIKKNSKGEDILADTVVGICFLHTASGLFCKITKGKKEYMLQLLGEVENNDKLLRVLTDYVNDTMVVGGYNSVKGEVIFDDFGTLSSTEVEDLDSTNLSKVKVHRLVVE